MISHQPAEARIRDGTHKKMNQPVAAGLDRFRRLKRTDVDHRHLASLVRGGNGRRQRLFAESGTPRQAVRGEIVVCELDVIGPFGDTSIDESLRLWRIG